MEAIGDEVSNKIRSAIKAKFKEIGVHVDEELPDYVMVMVANKRSKEQMDEDLQLFLGKHTSLFTTWLHQVLQKLQEVTVAKLDVQRKTSSPTYSPMNVEELIGLVYYENHQSIGGIKRKSSDETKKKKKSKQESEKKEIRKKIKEEPEDKDRVPKDKDTKREVKDKSESENDKEIQINDSKPNKKQKNSSKPSQENIKDAMLKNKKQKEDSPESNHDEQIKSGVIIDGRNKSLIVSSQIEDLEDEDCINIRTDGELLDTTEDVNLDDSSKKTRATEDSDSKSKADKSYGKQTKHSSPVRNKDKSKSSHHNGLDKMSTKEKLLSPQRSSSPPKATTKSDEKVIDARELLNRKKAAKQADSRKRSRSQSRDRDHSLSPVRKRKEEDRESRNYRDERSSYRKLREEEKETSSRKYSREEERDRRALRDRESHPLKRREEWPRKLESDRDRIDSRNKEHRRESSIEPPPKRVMLDRTFKDKDGTSRGTKPSEGLKGAMESPSRRDSEEGLRRPGLVSRVVARVQEPEENDEAPGGVPSVVKVTPRPRRPPSQQPSSSLIMRAISEANKSLANVPQRPDSTQRGRKEPVLSRPFRQLRRIPPEKIAVEIKNPLAVQSGKHLEKKEEDTRSVSPIPKDRSGRNMSPPPDHFNMEATPSDPDVPTPTDTRTRSVTDEQNEEKSPKPEIEPEDEIELEPSQDLEALDEPMDETSEPQFVVTLNGYDPDGIFSQSELDDDEEPLLTSTPDEVESPRPKREVNSSPNVIMGTPAVNHNNLIEVEILRSKSERCKYWPACRLGDKCTYYHPSKPCKMFPNCKFGDGCLYIHPQCKFNALCTRKDCVFAHTPAHTPVQPAVIVAPKAKALYAASVPPCKFFPNCTNIHCQFSHPLRACRFGLYCTKKDCSFDHGQVAPVDKLKWTRVPPS